MFILNDSCQLQLLYLSLHLKLSFFYFSYEMHQPLTTSEDLGGCSKVSAVCNKGSVIFT